jgi:hypothetical protein
MAYPISGCVQSGPDKWQKKCDRCNNIENILRQVPKPGWSENTVYHCNKCKHNSKVVIKG